MRIFSAFEKDLLKEIVEMESDGRQLIQVNLILKPFLDTNSEVTITGRSKEFVSNENENYYYKMEFSAPSDNLDKAALNISSKLYITNTLLDYLLSEGYIIMFEELRIPEIIISARDINYDNSQDEHINFEMNKSIKEFLCKCGYLYQSTEALRDLVKNKFQTPEERNNEKTRRLSKYSIAVSLVSAAAAISSLSLNYYINNVKKPPTVQDIRIDTSNIKYLIDRSTLRPAESHQDSSKKINGLN